MLTYQVRRRLFRPYEGGTLDLPNCVEVTFVFQPLQPFGAGSGGGRTAVRAVAATATIDVNSGRYTIDSEAPLRPLNVTIEDPSLGTVELRGNELRIFTTCETLKELNGLIETVYYLLPMLLNVEFVDPPVVELVSGKVGSTPFRWELAVWKMDLETTTQEKQEKKVISSWDRFELISQATNRRLVAALH